MSDTQPSQHTDGNAALHVQTAKKLGSTGEGHVLNLDADIIVFHEGDESDFAYLVVEGRVELTKNMEGTEIFLAEIGPGDLFGEMGLIDGNARSATATTVEGAVLHRINHDELMERLGNDSDFAAPVITQLVGQLRATSDRLAHEKVLSLQRAADAADVVVLERPSIFRRLTGFFDADLDLLEFQPDAVEIEHQKTPAIAKVMLYVIAALMVGTFLWANYSSIDTAVSAMGRITTEVPNIVVQPSETAMIRDIRVRVGDHVEEGQLLATLDATVAEADVNVSRASLVSIQAKERRLEAELTDTMPLDGFADDPVENSIQLEIFERRQQGLASKLESFDEQFQQIKAEIKTNVQDARDLGEQSEVLHEIEAMRKKLMDDGHGSRVNYLSAKHQRLSVDREQRNLLSTRSRMEHQLKGLAADRASTLADWQARVAQEYAEVRGERERVAEQLVKTEHRESLVRLVAPTRGIVLKIAERSVGSIIQQAEMMFTIVPADVPMEMEVDVLPKDVGLIQVGDFVRIKLDALPFQKHGYIEGQVRLISEDAVEADDSSGAQSVYRTRIRLAEHKLRDVPATFRLTPGLTGSADITVGKRKVITYFVYPIMRAFSDSFREP